jgi:hypothetical protein
VEAAAAQSSRSEEAAAAQSSRSEEAAAARKQPQRKAAAAQSSRTLLAGLHPSCGSPILANDGRSAAARHAFEQRGSFDLSRDL